jgi:hypothetical protein
VLPHSSSLKAHRHAMITRFKIWPQLLHKVASRR